MKLIRFAKKGNFPIPGIVDSTDQVRDLSSMIEDWSACTVSEQIKKLQSLDTHRFPIVGHVKDVCILPCVPRPGKLICIAFNSRGHTKQMNGQTTDAPIFFLKATSAIVGANDPIIYSKVSQKIDWEGELGVVIAKKAKYVTQDKALDYVLGYCICNDVSDRYWQFERHSGLPPQHSQGKSFDSFAPIGPYLVTKDEIADPCQLQVTLKVNGEVRQDFSTQDYIFNVQTVVSYLSQLFVLEPGDIISMGTGPGNAAHWDNQFLKIGDCVELEISQLGKQINQVIAENS